MATLQTLAMPSGIAVVCALPPNRIHRFRHVPNPLHRRTRMDLYRAFNDLHLAGSAMEFTAVALSERRRDFLAKASDGSPVFLLHDASAATYSPAISLKTVSVQFHSTCRVTTATGTVEDQFAVVACDASVPSLFIALSIQSHRPRPLRLRRPSQVQRSRAGCGP